MVDSITPITRGTKDIPVRHMDFEFDQDIPLFWMGGDPIQSMILTGLSCTFPEGERMFMRAVRRYQKKIEDPDLQKRVRAFLGQEAHHGREHHEFNEFMEAKGLPTMKVDKFVKAGIAREEKFFSAARMLARTCALEHFTAMFAEALLEHPEIADHMDERMKPLWLWHAIEESEHKSVAFDVFQDQVNSHWIRTSEMATISVLFTFFTALHTVHLLANCASPQEISNSFFQNGKRLWKNRKLLAKLGREYRNYYRRDFHPSQKDSRPLRQVGLQRLKALLGEKAHYELAV